MACSIAARGAEPNQIEAACHTLCEETLSADSQFPPSRYDVRWCLNESGFVCEERNIQI